MVAGTSPLTLTRTLTSPKARDRRFHHGYVCPRCKSAQVQRWGRERAGPQRYRGFGCHRTFNDLT
ncbi:IS1 family transposase [Gemmatimonas sp.]|uniref:IS1/IS1595 family N-terminal zinc-binding domain-containing protein n=1 Tax=Gemmatimonas sp. TaxID=1962908 RepID=UPI0037BFE558